MQKSSVSHTLRCLCEGAILIALAQILGYLKFWVMPAGGSVTLAMLPIAVFAWRWGLKPGLSGGFVFGLLQLTLDGAYAWGWQSIIGDYLLAFTLLGIGGLFREKKFGLICALLLGAFLRFVVHWVVGALVWADLTPAAAEYTSNWLYSLAYNAPYLVLSTIVCAVPALLLEKPLSKLPR